MIICLFSSKLFAQEESIGEIIPCQDVSILCSQVHPSENVIRNEKEYQALLNVRSLHPDCDSYKLPLIDFNQYTLLGISFGAGGSKVPIIEHQIIKLTNGNYRFIVKIKQKVGYEREWSYEIWCLIPKIENNENVEFKKEIQIEN